MTQTVVIIGARGQVGSSLMAAARSCGFEPVGLSSKEAPLTDLGRLRSALSAYPDAPVINAAAYTAVDRAEMERELAYSVNAVGPSWLASLVHGDRPLIHYSTDYVFDGHSARPYVETDETAPKSVYGLSKRMGELAVQSHPRGYIIRTAWVFSAERANFLKTMLRIGREKRALSVVDDQRGTPTHAGDIAQATFALLRSALRGSAAPGVYHLTAQGETSWYGFATEIFDCLRAEGGPDVKLEPIPSTAYPTAASRPAYSVLDCSKIDRIVGLDRPAWRNRVAQTVKQVLAEQGTNP
jgi:dTDP-4-dehydrorhamnose reductase